MRKIRCVYVDGMSLSGKTSIMRELRMLFKDQNKEIYEVDGTNLDRLEQQGSILNDIDNSLILKERTVLGLFHDDLKSGFGVNGCANMYKEALRVEKAINNTYGAVHFFLQPTHERNLDIYNGKIPNYVKLLDNFFNMINDRTFTQGLDIHVIKYDEFDKIYEVRDKILKILTSDYNFTS